MYMYHGGATMHILYLQLAPSAWSDNLNYNPFEEACCISVYSKVVHVKPYLTWWTQAHGFVDMTVLTYTTHAIETSDVRIDTAVPGIQWLLWLHQN